MSYTKSHKASLYNQCIAKWGFQMQATMAMEEAAEFIKALSKYQRTRAMEARDSSLDVNELVVTELAEEITDLRLMLNQMESALNLHELCATTEELKLDRLIKRLEE